MDSFDRTLLQATVLLFSSHRIMMIFDFLLPLRTVPVPLYE
jgi:hypothetical protein